MAALLLSACTGTPQALASGASPQGAEPGRRTFETYCQACHGPGGRGLIGPALDASGHAYEHTDENLYRTITRGTAGGMPSWAGILSPAEVKQAIAHVKALWTDDQRGFQSRVTATGFGGMR
ncbi:MAG: cytochrome c [Chloroflexi bacterium]|nr:cytochrome c [Chloroflexota bacterium]